MAMAMAMIQVVTCNNGDEDDAGGADVRLHGMEVHTSAAAPKLCPVFPSEISGGKMVDISM